MLRKFLFRISCSQTSRTRREYHVETAPTQARSRLGGYSHLNYGHSHEKNDVSLRIYAQEENLWVEIRVGGMTFCVGPGASEQIIISREFSLLLQVRGEARQGKAKPQGQMNFLYPIEFPSSWPPAIKLLVCVAGIRVPEIGKLRPYVYLPACIHPRRNLKHSNRS